MPVMSVKHRGKSYIYLTIQHTINTNIIVYIYTFKNKNILAVLAICILTIVYYTFFVCQ